MCPCHTHLWSTWSAMRREFLDQVLYWNDSALERKLADFQAAYYNVLSSGVAGTMAASRSGLQRSTVRNLAIAWVLTLPAAILLAGTLFWFFSKLF